MKQMSATEIKTNRINSQKIPKPGTRIRKLYDKFQRKKGRVITVDYKQYVNSGTFHTMIHSLTDFYGLDIRHMGCRQWCLLGEWFGKEYKDYIAENMEK